jgi:hypothetical protein
MLAPVNTATGRRNFGSKGSKQDQMRDHHGGCLWETLVGVAPSSRFWSTMLGVSGVRLAKNLMVRLVRIFFCIRICGPLFFPKLWCKWII